MELPQKIKNGAALWLSDSTSKNLFEETSNTNLKVYKQPYVYCSVIGNPQDLEAPQVSKSRWVDKTTIIYIHNGMLFIHKKEETFTLCNSLDGPGEHYAKWNKSVRERQISYDFTHMWNLMSKLK